MTPVTARRPQDFLELVERGRRGRLKLYIGFAAGVGKTWRMLEEAHALKQRGVDFMVVYHYDYGMEDFRSYPDRWGITPVGVQGDDRLYRIDQPK